MLVADLNVKRAERSRTRNPLSWSAEVRCVHVGSRQSRLTPQISGPPTGGSAGSHSSSKPLARQVR